MINTFNSLEELLLHYPKRSLGRAKDLTNQKFNRLTFICRIEAKEENQQAYWACKCECGKYTKVRATHVLQNKILSCGCYNDEKRKAGHNMYYSNYENLKNQKFNLLTVKDYAGKDKNNHAIWKCECECGNITFVTATHLKTGHTTSCGCTKESQYERRIKNWLVKNNYSFEREYKFLELGKLRFDFKVNINNKFLLIEMQGQQHYKPNSKFGGEEGFKRLIENDKRKIEFCNKNKIPLLIIKYDENIEEILKSTLFSFSSTTR